VLEVLLDAAAGALLSADMAGGADSEAGAELFAA
jgi:hypothetical protein